MRQLDGFLETIVLQSGVFFLLHGPALAASAGTCVDPSRINSM